MLNIKFLLLSLFISSASFGQGQINLSLKKELDSLNILDQKYRGALMANFLGKGDSLAKVYSVKKEDLDGYLWKLQGEIDSLNTIKVEEIINRHGYPGASLVGMPTNEAAFLIIQHSKVIDKYLPIILDAAKKNEIRFRLYALMLDRSLKQKDMEQVYGTQGSSMSIKSAITGNWENLSFIWPVKDATMVNERRKTAGFDQTVEEYSKSLNIDYKVFTLDEILKLRSEVIKANSN